MDRLASSILECPDIKGIWNINNSSSNETLTMGDVTLSQSGTGPYIHVICPEGSHVVGPTMITCLNGGIWDDVTKPSCSTSTIFGIAQSDIILISVLAGSGALVILGLTIVLTHLLCFRERNPSPSLCNERLDRCSESNPSSSAYYFDDKCINSISTPTSVTLNGQPLHSSYDEHREHPNNPPNYQSRSMERSAIVLSYNVPQADNTFSLPRYFVQKNRPSYRDDSSQPGNGYLRPVDTSADTHHMPHPGRQDHVFLNHAYTEDMTQDFAERWQDSSPYEEPDSFSSNSVDGEYYENVD